MSERTFTESGTLEIAEGPVRFRAAGSGPPVVCSELPLNPFCRFEPLQQLLANSYRVIVLDFRPVLGRSTRRPPASDLLPYLAAATFEAADALGLGSFSLVGSFMFGGVAMEAARQTPVRVRSLVLLGSTGIVRLPVTPLLSAITGFYRLPGMPAVLRWMPATLAIEWMDRQITGPLRLNEIFYRPKRVPVTLADLYEMHKKPRCPYSSPALMWAIRNLRYERLVQRLDEIVCPTLIIHGEKDKWIPLRYARELHNRVIGSTLAVVPDTRHMPEVENSAMTVALIQDFLSRTEPVGR